MVATLPGLLKLSDKVTIIFPDLITPFGLVQPAVPKSIVMVLGKPESGVTVIVAVTAVVPALVAVKDAISPLPLAANPILVVLFVQLNVVPLTAPVKVINDVPALLHNVWFDG